jgi:hypothetical protein
MAEGKKIRLKDGFSALGALLKHSFGPPPPPRPSPAPREEENAPRDRAAEERPA